MTEAKIAPQDQYDPLMMDTSAQIDEDAPVDEIDEIDQILNIKQQNMLAGPEKDGLPFWIDLFCVFFALADEQGQTPMLMRRAIAENIGVSQNAISSAVQTLRAKEWIAPGKNKFGDRDGTTYTVWPRGVRDIEHYCGCNYQYEPIWVNTPEKSEKRARLVMRLISIFSKKLQKSFAMHCTMERVEFMAYRAADRFYLADVGKAERPQVDENEIYRQIEARGKRGLTLAEMDRSPTFRIIDYATRTAMLNSLRDQGRVAFRIIPTGGRNREAWVCAKPDSDSHRQAS